MKIREAAKEWPPHAVGGFGGGAIADVGDAVLTAHRHGGVKEHITLGVRKEDATIYIVVLDLPVRLLGRALTAIKHEKEITLAELGELDI